jgi:hypothetical protein
MIPGVSAPSPDRRQIDQESCKTVASTVCVDGITAGIRWKLPTYGDSERLHGMQEVRGSSPLSSTRKSRCSRHLVIYTREVISIFFRISSPTLTNVRRASTLDEAKATELGTVSPVLRLPGSGGSSGSRLWGATRSIRKLLEALGSWVDRGHSGVAITHEPSLILFADWVIDLGPAFDQGRGVLAEGTPADVAVLNADRKSPGLSIL